MLADRVLRRDRSSSAAHAQEGARQRRQRRRRRRRRRRGESRGEAAEDGVHGRAAGAAKDGIHREPLPDGEAPSGPGPRTATARESNQNLVPEQAGQDQKSIIELNSF